MIVFTLPSTNYFSFSNNRFYDYFYALVKADVKVYVLNESETLIGIKNSFHSSFNLYVKQAQL